MSKNCFCGRCGKIVDDSIYSKLKYCVFCGNAFDYDYDQNNKVFTPNLVIHFITTNKKYEMITRIVATGQKDVYKNGDTYCYFLKPGEHRVVTKMAARNREHLIYIQSGKVVTIYASFTGKPTYYIDQPGF